MKSQKVKLQVFEVREAPYGDYNREVVAYCDKFGLIEGCMVERNCSLEVGNYRGGALVNATVAVFGSGRVLIEKL